MKATVSPQSSSPFYFFYSNLTGKVLAACLGTAIGLLVITIDHPFKTLLIAFALLAVLAVIVKIEFGLYILIFITFTNLSRVAVDYHNAPSIAKLLVFCLIFGLVIRELFRSEQLPHGVNRLALALTIYGLVGLTSLFYAPEAGPVLKTLWSYIKDSFLSILVVLILQRGHQLRASIWVLLLAGALLGSLGVYQQLTESFDNHFWGFAQAYSLHIVGGFDSPRIAGPLGGPNYFAQFLLVIIPLAIERLYSERSWLLKAAASYTMITSLLALIYTYSRGGLVAFFIMLFCFALLQPRRLWLLLLLILLTIPLLQLVPGQYFSRMKTLEGIFYGKRQTIIAEGSFRGRLSEMIVAYNIFSDHPLLGIGLGNYEPHYQKYAQQIFLDTRREDRNAHCRYLEILAETGILGLTAFFLLLGSMFYGLHQAYYKLARSDLSDEYQRIVLALGLAMVGFLAAYLFLHDAYPRFFWILVGILYAIPNIINNDIKNPDRGLY